MIILHITYIKSFRNDYENKTELNAKAILVRLTIHLVFIFLFCFTNL